MRQILFVQWEQDEGGCFALHRFTTIVFVSRIQGCIWQYLARLHLAIPLKVRG
jgi:hypothetical protein